MIPLKSYRIWCCCALWTLVFVPAEYALAQSAATVSLPVAELQADSAIPAIQAITGHDWATHITNQSEMERYLDTLVKAAPDRAKLEKYGESYEGRGLYYLVISCAENMQRLEEIRLANLQLAETQPATSESAAPPIAQMPALVWLAASVHGNELSSTEAALLTAYHLLADQRPETKQLLEQLVILIDPLQNPDGRARFVSVYGENRGVFDSADPLSTEHAERWPGGRFNHYLFDLNRDWFLQSQQESQYKVRAYRHWQPQIYVDAHEMGPNSTYFFVPPSDPINSFMLASQKEWMWKLGRQQAEWFDRYGFSYTTREMFDAFFPGYGSEWPTLQGGLGVLWEQAGVRGLSVDRDDELTLHYREAVLHHYISALATLEIAAAQRVELLTNFQAASERAIQLGEEGPVKYFVLPTRLHRDRTRKLVQLLERNGVRVQQIAKTFRVAGTDMRSGKKSTAPCRLAATSSLSRSRPGGSCASCWTATWRWTRRMSSGNWRARRTTCPRKSTTSRPGPCRWRSMCRASPRSNPLPRTCWPKPARMERQQIRKAAQPLPPAQVAYLVRPTDGALYRLKRLAATGSARACDG